MVLNKNTSHPNIANASAVILQSLFGASSEDNVDVISKSFEVISDFFASSAEFFVQLPLWVPTSRNRKFIQAMSSMDRVVSDIIQKRRGGEQRRDLMERIVHKTSDETDKIIRDEIRTHMLAGHETTSLSIVFSLWLAEHPKIQEEVWSSIIQVTQGNSIESHHRHQLTLVENVIKKPFEYTHQLQYLYENPSKMML